MLESASTPFAKNLQVVARQTREGSGPAEPRGQVLPIEAHYWLGMYSGDLLRDHQTRAGRT